MCLCVSFSMFVEWVQSSTFSNMKIEALHDFHDAQFSQGWADKFQPTPPRMALFETILQEIKTIAQPNITVLELGIGPGYLADYILQRYQDIQYEGLDFSLPMLQIAEARTEVYGDSIDFTQADLIKEEWQHKVKKQPQVIVTTWALHDLFEKKNILDVYQKAYSILPKGGFLLNGDFIKPETSTYEYEGGRVKPSEHLALLQEAGFSSSICLEKFEISVDQPTTANNYACFKAVK